MMIAVLGRQVYETRNPRFEGNHAVEENKLVMKIGLLFSYPANS
jgi:hexokinase